MYKCVCLHTRVCTPVCVYSCVNRPLPNKRKHALHLRIFAFSSPWLSNMMKVMFPHSWNKLNLWSTKKVLTAPQTLPRKSGVMLRNKHSCQRACSINSSPSWPLTWTCPPSFYLDAGGSPWMPCYSVVICKLSSLRRSSKVGPLCSWSQAWIASALLVMWIKKKSNHPVML